MGLVTPLPWIDSLWSVFEVMVDRGMSAMDAIKSATSLAAFHIFMQEDAGAIEVGRFGNLIVVRNDPLADITVLQNIDVVVKCGLIFKMKRE